MQCLSVFAQDLLHEKEPEKITFFVHLTEIFFCLRKVLKITCDIFWLRYN